MDNALSHGKEVKVLEVHGPLSRVQPVDGDEWDAVWVRSTSLKPVPKVKVPKGHVEVASLTPATDDVVIPTSSLPQPKAVIPAKTNYANFLPSWLLNPRLKLHTRFATLETALSEYVAWTGGESFPEDKINAVSERDKKYTWSPFHEWQLTFRYDGAVSYPFPIVPSGQGGGLKLGEPAGILKGNTVTVSFKNIIEPLVRAGLRA